MTGNTETISSLSIIEAPRPLAQAAFINEELYDNFIESLDVAESTAKTYTAAMLPLVAFLRERGVLNHPTHRDILAYKKHLDMKDAAGNFIYTASTRRNYLTAAKKFFAWAEAEGIYPNITKAVKGAKVDRDFKKDPLDQTDVKTLLDSIDREDLTGLRDYALLALLIGAGLRTVEVARANIGDISTAAGITELAVQGKGHDDKDDTVPLEGPVLDAIKAYLEARGERNPKAPLFTSLSNRKGDGGRMNTKSISRIVKTRLRDAGYDSSKLTAHSLRHTTVTLALLNGCSIEEVMKLARHANITTTMIYAHHIDRAKAKRNCTAAIAAAIF